VKQLLFKAVPGSAVRHPFASYVPGQPAQFIGGAFDGGQFKPSAEPEAINCENLDAEQTRKLAKLLREVKRDGCLEPADNETRVACGMSPVFKSKKGDS
jgi:hypothetical protein